MIAAIQAGGRSSRMGEDKSWLVLNDRPMIESVLAAAQGVTNQLALVINASNPNLARYEQLVAQWNAELLFDLHDHRGPLGGIETALQYSNETTLMLACDLPFVTTEFLRLLAEIHQAEQCDLTVPLDVAGYPQMLAAIYSAACLPQVSAMLAANELKVQWLQQRVNTRRVRWEEYAHLLNAERLLTNLNSQEDMRTVGI